MVVIEIGALSINFFPPDFNSSAPSYMEYVWQVWSY